MNLFLANVVLTWACAAPVPTWLFPPAPPVATIGYVFSWCAGGELWIVTDVLADGKQIQATRIDGTGQLFWWSPEDIRAACPRLVPPGPRAGDKDTITDLWCFWVYWDEQRKWWVRCPNQVPR